MFTLYISGTFIPVFRLGVTILEVFTPLIPEQYVDKKKIIYSSTACKFYPFIVTVNYGNQIVPVIIYVVAAINSHILTRLRIK